MTKTVNNQETAEFLRTHDHYLILNHRRPDGDAVGSAAALCRGLRAMGKEAWVWKNPQTSQRLSVYLTGLETEAVPDQATIVSVDMATENLLPMNGAEFIGKTVLSIDHHMSNEGYAAMTNVQPACAACGELLLDILSQLGPVDQTMAEALYLAISTDTGCFQYSNVTGNTLRAAAALKDLGADTFPINKIMFGTKTIARLRLESALTESIEFYAGGKVGLCVMTNAMLDAIGASADDTDDISGFARNIEGVEIGVMIQELREGGAKISLRTDEAHNASDICGQLGGGGHKAAAGATVPGGVSEAKERILEAIAHSGVKL
ncbi:MAG: DHH family phosphoesterase [Oscillospiraceae bacterium]|nr:DHH family phosphoesterase [Oscillospiraceae bacterium]